jgi:YD repeat-containing protein
MTDPTANPQAMVIAIKRDPRPHGPHTAVTDPAGAVTAYVYDNSGHLERTVEPARPVWRNGVATDSLAPTSVAGRNTVGKVTQSRDASGAVTWKRSCQELQEESRCIRTCRWRPAGQSMSLQRPRLHAETQARGHGR